MKQPYIPLYVGDYIKDTRGLPLDVRGAWADIIFYAWDSKSKGVLNVTLDELCGMLACHKNLLVSCLRLLDEKNICDMEKPNDFFEPGVIKITVRRIVRDVAKSEEMARRGKIGGQKSLGKKETKKDAQAFSGSDNNSIKNIKESLVFPFDSEAFKKHWNLWVQFRKEIGHPIKSNISAQASLKFLSNYTEGEAIRIIEKSIANSWRGLFKPDKDGKITKTDADKLHASFTDFAESRRSKQ